MSGVVVVGSGPGGLEAVKAFRERDTTTAVVLVTADPHPPYARPPLTKDYLTGDAEKADLWLSEPGWFDSHDVSLLLNHEVVALDRTSRRLGLSDGSALDYDRLVLATGSRPQPLPIPGGNDPGVILIRDLRSGERLRALADHPSRIVVIGSGFIGCEAAAQLASRGSDVVMVTGEDRPHERRLGRDAGDRIAGWLRDDGVTLRTGAEATRIERHGDRWSVELADGSRVDGDAVVCGGGARPNLEVGEQAGLSVAEGGFAADASLRSVDDTSILVVGDIAYAHNTAAGRSIRVEHWGDAETQGKIAGAVAAGGDAVWSSAPGFWSTIGSRTLKYSAWGDGYDDYRVEDQADGGWNIRYFSDGALCGVLAVDDDDAYERGQRELESN